MHSMRKSMQKRPVLWVLSITFLVILVGALFLLMLVSTDWFFAKTENQGEDNAIQEEQGNNSNNSHETTTLLPSLISPPQNPTAFPSSSPTSPYEFLQCNASIAGSDCCNGLTTICDLRVNEIMFAMAHNGFATKHDGFLNLYNHLLPLEEAFHAGYRGISLDIGKCDGELALVHEACALGTRVPIEVFDNIVSLLKRYPTEVVLINIQLDQVSIAEVYAFLQGISGLAEMLYNHNSGSSSNNTEETGEIWPTLGSLVESNQRILLFYHNAPTSCSSSAQNDGSNDNNSTNVETCPPDFLDWFSFAAETEFEFDNVEAVLNDTKSACQISRGGGGSSAVDFFGINMFTKIPQQTSSVVLNQKQTLQTQIQACQSLNGLAANVVSVDFWSQGNLPEVVQLHNDALGKAQQANNSSNNRTRTRRLRTS